MGETGARNMTRQLLSWHRWCFLGLFLEPFLGLLLGCCVLLPAREARADDLPIRKAGLWEMKILKTGSGLPDMTMQHCTDETTDKDMSNTVSPMAKQVCSKQDIQKTASGYVSDSVCTVAGVSITSHSEITGDFNSAYSVKTSAHIQHGDKPVDTVTTIEAKWLGACKPDQKPGDIVMPGGGFKLNIKDADKLKGLLPK
jgi:Protein of unknown function (DUF3617)